MMSGGYPRRLSKRKKKITGIEMHRTVWFSCRHSEERSRYCFFRRTSTCGPCLARIFPKQGKILEIWVWLDFGWSCHYRKISVWTCSGKFHLVNSWDMNSIPQILQGRLEGWILYICSTMGIKNPVSTKKQDFFSRQNLKIFNRTFPLLVFTHVIQPCEKRVKTNDNQELVKPNLRKGTL